MNLYNEEQKEKKENVVEKEKEKGKHAEIMEKLLYEYIILFKNTIYSISCFHLLRSSC